MSQDNQLNKAFEMIEEGVKNVYSSENYRRYLEFLSKFHDYSFNNTMLILSQKPEASHIAGFRAWKNLFNRQVKKGEKAINILAPYQTKIVKEVTKTDDDGKPVYDDKGEPVKEQKEVQITRFRMVNVFDISQTIGEEVPTFVRDLQGSSYDAQALIMAIEELSPIEIKYETRDSDLILRNGAKGYYSVTEDRIVVNEELSLNQKAKTLSHEFVHSLLHKETEKGQKQREIEAESIAFVICDHFHIDTSEYSFGYIAAYANEDYEFLKETLVNIQSNAHEYISKIEPVFLKLREQVMVESRYMAPLELEEYSKKFIHEVESFYADHGYDETLKTTDAREKYVFEGIEEATGQIVNCLNMRCPGQYHLYQTDPSYRRKVNESIYCHLYKGDEESRPFLDQSLERKNYEAFEQIARPLLDGDTYYLKYASMGNMDLNVEKLDDDQIVISHNFSLNGDLMADPMVELRADRENKLLHPVSFRMDSLGAYQDKETNPKIEQELNSYMGKWLVNIHEKQYHLTQAITETDEFSLSESRRNLEKYCKENGIVSVMPKRKEKVR